MMRREDRISAVMSLVGRDTGIRGLSGWFDFNRRTDSASMVTEGKVVDVTEARVKLK